MSENVKKMDTYSKVYQGLENDNKLLAKSSIDSLANQIEELDLDDEAIDSFKDRISSTAEGAKNEDFIAPEKIKIDDNAWSDGKLTFVPRSDGTYLIKKILDNGEEVAMGFTDELGVQKFLSINDSIINDIDDSIEIPLGKIRGTVVASEDIENNLLERTAATVGVGVVSFGEGVLQFGEGLIDVGAMLGSGVLSLVTGTIDVMNFIDSKLTGNEHESVTKKLWDKTNAFTSKEHVTSLVDKYFYEGSEAGQWLKENSYAFDTVRTLGNLAGSITAGGVFSKFVIGMLPIGRSNPGTGLSIVTNYGDDTLAVVGETAVNYGDDAVNAAANVGDDIARIGVNSADDAANIANEATAKFDELQKVYAAVKNGEIKTMSEARKVVNQIYGNIDDGSQVHEVLSQISNYFKGKPVNF